MKVIIFMFSFVGLLLMAGQQVSSQDKVANKVIFAELGGPGVITSINFDTRFKPGERLGLGFRVGAGFSIGDFGTMKEYNDDGYHYTGDGSVMRSYYTIPVEINYIFGSKESMHTFEVGAGVTALTRKASLFYYEDSTPGYAIGHLSFMYRIMPVNGGFSFRVGLTPIIGTSGDLFPMVAVSFGYAF